MRRIALAVLCLVLGVGCATPTPTPTSARSVRGTPFGEAPTLVNANPFFTASNGTWVFNVSVDPNGSSTDVVLEYGTPFAGPPAFDQTVVAAQHIMGPRAVATRIDLPIGDGFCVRFTATNEVGVTSGEPYCQRPLKIPPPSS